MILLASAVLAATAYTDPLGRFSLSRPDGWEPVTVSAGPGARASDTTAFRRQSDNLLANVVVFVIPAPPGESTAGLAKASGRAVARTPGYKALSEGDAKLGALDARRRRYLASVGTEGKWQKMVEERLAVSGDDAFIVHAETLAESFATFEPDFDAIFASFSAAPKGLGAGDTLLDAPLVGRWEMVGAAGTFLELRSDGTFDLAGTKGTYTVAGAALRMTPRGSGVEEFRWRVRGDELVIEGPTLGGPIVYRRVRVAAPAARP